MTGCDLKMHNELKPLLKLQKHGVVKISVVPVVIPWWQEQSKAANLFVSLVFDAQRKNHWRTMKIMTNHLMLCGYANHVTSSATKNFY
jgi:hypothetical protein